ncbi:MAG: hypothetical protein J3R72DRAFT_511459 [Linnemannia gamsii]|nr:MAG: hypothetical protein J3R72DRAFT_511459 [Linnemannia gamsii]
MKSKTLMYAQKEKSSSDDSRPRTPSPAQLGSTPVKESRFAQLQQVTKNLFRTSIRKKHRKVPKAPIPVQCGSIGVLVPQEHQSGATLSSVDSNVNDLLPALPPFILGYLVAPSPVQSNSNKDLAPSASIILQPMSTSAPTDFNPKADALGLPAPASGDRMDILL